MRRKQDYFSHLKYLAEIMAKKMITTFLKRKELMEILVRFPVVIDDKTIIFLNKIMNTLPQKLTM